LAKLASEAELVGEFLGDAFGRLQRFVEGLDGQVVRGRSAEAIASDPAVRAEFGRELAAWADSYEVPTFARDEKTLVKLRAFLTTKLPA
jgi:hypothetical protein